MKLTGYFVRQGFFDFVDGEDYLPMVNAIISAIRNLDDSRETIAESIVRTSESVYGVPITREDALQTADGIRLHPEIL